MGGLGWLQAGRVAGVAFSKTASSNVDNVGCAEWLEVAQAWSHAATFAIGELCVCLCFA
jgi:hypothetical protein